MCRDIVFVLLKLIPSRLLGVVTNMEMAKVDRFRLTRFRHTEAAMITYGHISQC